jgi:pimeloyl-ACP methyl ester carboxylesterase
MTVELHHHDVGEGPPLVLLHAFPLPAAMWLDVAGGLAGRYRVIAPDQRGWGGSPLGDGPPSLDAAAGDVAALLDRLGLDRVVLGGLSMGGYVAMAFARRYPERLRGLVLADTKATADTPAAAENRERIARTAEETGSGDVLLESVLPALVGATTRAERPMVYEQVRELVLAAPPAAVAWAQRAMAARPDSFDTLRAVAVPALVLVGDEDTLATPADAAAMAAALPDATLVTVPGSGHLTAMERPDAVVAALADHLARYSR